MTDIDFDELDKAVNSLMGTVPKNEPVDDNPKSKLLNISSTLKPGEKPAYDRLGEVARQIGNETLITDGELTIVEELDPEEPAKPPVAEPVVAALPQETSEPAASVAPLVAPDPVPESAPAVIDTPVAPPVPVATPKPAAPVVKRPNSGRFMDVVHSSSDMKSPDFPPLVVPERVVPKASAPVTTPALPKDEEREKFELPVPVEPVAFTAPVEPASVPEPAPLTPFLPDAKVEKRPLGGALEPVGAVPSPFEEEGKESKQDDVNSGEKLAFATITNGVHESGAADGAGPSDTQKSLNATDFSFTQTTDEEAVRAIESHETNPNESVSSAAVPTPTPEANAEAAPETTSEEHVRAVESADTESLSTGAIGRQYTQQPVESTDSEDSAIYDVDEYHQPLGHPARQRSGWGIVTIIALIVVICSGLVAAAYFMLGTGA